MSYARRVAYNTIIQIIGRLFTTVVSLMTVSILNGQLGDVRWGSYVASTTYLGFFAVLADLGVNTLYLREISRFPERADEITAQFFGFRLFTAIVVLGLAPLTALVIPTYHPLIIPILIASVGQLFLVMNQIFVSVVQAKLLMDRAMITDILGRTVILLGTFLFVRHVPLSMRLPVALWALAIGNGVNAFGMYLFVRPLVHIKFRFNIKEWPYLFKTTLPMGALTVLGLIHFKADSVILTFIKPVVDVGIYGNAYKIIEIMITLPSMFVGGLFPAMSQALHKKEANFEQFMQKAFDALVFVTLPLVGAVFIFSPLIIAVLTRDNITQSADSLKILSLAMFPLYMGTLFGNMLLAANKQLQLSMYELVAAVANIGLNLWLIPRFSYYGAATTTLITEVLVLCLTIRLSYRVVGRIPRLNQIWASLGLGLPVIVVMGLVFSYVPFFTPQHFDHLPRIIQAGSVLGTGIIYCLIYAVPFFLTRQFPSVLQDRIHRVRSIIGMA